ncbi:hypothetical protein N9A45_00865 [bacterium]|nr:hypothetical protein [bacterium]
MDRVKPLLITSPKKLEEREKRITNAKAAQPPSPASSMVKNFVQELVELTQLFREGALTEKEFTLAKTKLLS